MNMPVTFDYTSFLYPRKRNFGFYFDPDFDSFELNLDIVAETPSDYNLFVSYKNRKNLTFFEKKAVGNYQDVYIENIQKQNWSFPIPKNWRQKSYCYTINSSLRFPDFYNQMKQEEKDLINYHIQNVDSAISKSRITGNRFAYRGIDNDGWLPPDRKIGHIFYEKAYSSFSLQADCAYKYVNPENPIFFRLWLPENVNALYLDDSEFEILFPRSLSFQITGIGRENLQITPTLNKFVTVYDIRTIVR